MTPASLPLFIAADLVPLETPRRVTDDLHLQAARHLSRRMARLRDRSPEQRRAGVMICRHLIAMLETEDAANDSTPHLPH